jgi:hypothetical protein
MKKKRLLVKRRFFLHGVLQQLLYIHQFIIVFTTNNTVVVFHRDELCILKPILVTLAVRFIPRDNTSRTFVSQKSVEKIILCAC